MPTILSAEATAVVRTFVAVYPEYVRSRVNEGALTPELESAIGEGAAWLEAELISLLAIDFSAQRRGPLELFQEATRFPTEALATAGNDPQERPPVEQSALPGDRFGLAPASSQDLGEPAWKAHVAWGVTKAAVVAGAVPASRIRAEPRVAIVGGSIADRSVVERNVHRAGLQFVLWRNPAAIEQGLAAGPPLLAIIDLDHAAAGRAVAVIAEAGGRVLAFGGGVDDLQQAATMALGAEDVVDRDHLEAAVARMLPTKA
jgi:hypothetical protein